jgi:hypothetical protein
MDQCTRYAELTLQGRQRATELQAERAPWRKAVPELRAHLLQHLETQGAVRQLLPGGTHVLKRMVSRSMRAVTPDAIATALSQALGRGSDDEIVAAFKRSLVDHVTVMHAYADVVAIGSRQDQSRCYAGVCTPEDMQTLPMLDKAHPLLSHIERLGAAQLALGGLKPVGAEELAALERSILEQVPDKGHGFSLGEQRMSVHRRQASRKPTMSAAVCSRQLAVTLAGMRLEHGGIQGPELVGLALEQALTEYIVQNTKTVQVARLVIHR